jgi:hypothetical protein
MCVCLSVCPYAIIQVQLFTLLHNNIYSTYFKKKLYILLHNNIYSTYFRKKLYIVAQQYICISRKNYIL